jgi:hypothetical protein
VIALGRVVDADADEPAEQQIEVQPLHELALRANRIERLQQHRPKQHLRRDRRPPHAGVERRKIGRQGRQHRVGQRPDRPPRVILMHALLEIDIREKLPRPLVRSPHRSPR